MSEHKCEPCKVVHTPGIGYDEPHCRNHNCYIVPAVTSDIPDQDQEDSVKAEQEHSVNAAIKPTPAPSDNERQFTSVDGILIHRAEFLVCDPCVKLEGKECHTPECVFCFQPVSVARAVLDKTLNCPIIDGDRLIPLGGEDQ